MIKNDSNIKIVINEKEIEEKNTKGILGDVKIDSIFERNNFDVIDHGTVSKQKLFDKLFRTYIVGSKKDSNKTTIQSISNNPQIYSKINRNITIINIKIK